jgi:small-conductance mechanosensitive channel
MNDEMKAQLATVFAQIRGLLDWAPNWMTAGILLVVAVLLAITVHAVVLALLTRVMPKKQIFFRMLVERTRGITRLALVIFLIGAALPIAPFERYIARGIAHVLLMAFVVLMAWMALVAVQLAADLYLRRFRMDSEDNLLARKHTTQVRILERAMKTLIVVFAAAAVLTTFDAVRQYGVSIFASAGLAGIVAGLAARPVLSNLIAGVQIAITQPIRIGDQVVVERERGLIEEITSTYFVIRLWDLRRLVVPLSYFIERPFENWTRETTSLLAPVILQLDYSTPIEPLRTKVDEIVGNSKLWDGAMKNVQVTDAREYYMEVRVLLSARNASEQFALRCEVREKLIAFLRTEYPHAFARSPKGDAEARKPVGFVERAPARSEDEV